MLKDSQNTAGSFSFFSGGVYSFASSIACSTASSLPAQIASSWSLYGNSSGKEAVLIMPLYPAFRNVSGRFVFRLSFSLIATNPDALRPAMSLSKKNDDFGN